MTPHTTSGGTAPRARRMAAAAIATCASLALAACGGDDPDTTAAAPTSTAAGSTNSSSPAAKSGGEIELWDPYPQYDAKSDWVKVINDCGTQAGVTIKRTGMDTGDVAKQTLLAAQQGSAPEIVIVDNPVVSTLADADVLVDTDTIGVDVSSYSENILGAGQIDGKTWGVPIGANSLALYYNKDILKAAGVDVASVKDWASLTAALEKVKAKGKKGITFSAVGTEEGSFQFLPWFWGSGANLTALDSAEGVSALQLWTDWVKKGLAPQSVINNTQTTSWQEFAAGDFAFAENGTWQLGNAAKVDFEWGLLPVPAAKGGNAPVPTGGEFVSVTQQEDEAGYAATGKVVSCLTQGENALKTDTALNYIAANEELQDKQAETPELKGWVDAVRAAKGRTSDNLGTKYPMISEPMFKAIQAALTGSASPADALKKAQADAASATK